MFDEDTQQRISELVLAHLPEGVVTIDLQDRITAVNPAAEAIYGFSANEALGHSITKVVDQFDLDGKSFDLAALRRDSPAHWNGRVITRPRIGSRQGSNVVVDLSLTAIRDEAGNPAGYMSIVRPVSRSTQLTTDAAMLGSLAVALSRSRGQREVAEASIQQLCQGTGADVAAVVTSDRELRRVVAGSTGLSRPAVDALERGLFPAVIEARSEPGTILGLEHVEAILAGQPGADLIRSLKLAGGLMVDLRVRDEVVGSLILGSRRHNWTRPPDGVILQVATQIANALENARYLEEERRVTAQLEAMMNLMRLPEGRVDEATIAQVLLGRIVGALGADSGIVIRNDNGRIRVLAMERQSDMMGSRLDGRPIEDVYSWRGLVERGGRAFHISLAELAATDAAIGRMVAAGVTSQTIFPLRHDDALIGAFICNFGATRERAGTLDERSLDAFGRIISIAYSNVKLGEGLAEAAERERRLAAEVGALQELTLLGASTDDLESLARETIEKVVLASAAAGGGYFLIEARTDEIRQICWVGCASTHWPEGGAVSVPEDWSGLAAIRQGDGGWLSGSDAENGRDYEAVLPLRVEDELVGFLHLEWTDIPGEAEFDLHFLEPIARVCSISLANFHLRSELVHRAAEQQSINLRLRTLNDLTQIGEEASSFEELAQRTVTLVREVLGATGVCYLLMEPGHHFETHALAGETGAFRLWLKGVPARDAPGGRLLISGSSSVLEDFVAGQVNERVLPLARATGFASFGAIPIKTGEELAGALLCFFEEPVAQLPVNESALDSVARIAGIALANYRLRESLGSSEERYRTLFAQTPDALFVTALDGTVLDANEAAVRTYRVNRGEMLGRYIGLLISADEREMARRRQIVWAQGRGTFRDRGRRHDASEFPVAIEIRVVELDGQRRFLHLIRDMSDEERLTGELLQAQKMEAIGSLVSGVAHELNNPLTGIIAFSALIRSDPRLPDDMRRDAELLVQEADRTKRIVQNLLDFARARKVERRPTRLADLIQSVLDLQSYAISAGQIEVQVKVADDVPEVDLDRAQFQQVFLNLTINAIQAMRADASHKPHHLWVSAELLDTARVRSDRLPDNARVRISVRDDGPGVPDAHRPNLFNPFFTTKEPGEGTGLGLSVSFGIVAAHGGQLSFEPPVDGVGACFVIEVPVKAVPLGDEPASFTRNDAVTALTVRTPRLTTEEPEPEAGTPVAVETSTEQNPRPAAVRRAPASDAPPAPRPRVLILDDEQVIRELLRRTLIAGNMEPHPFQDGAQALDGVQQMVFDAMLIDYRMAGMSGTEFYEHAVGMRPELANRAIFISGDVLDEGLLSFATARSIRLLAKPFEMGQALAAVRETIARPAAD